MFILVQFQYLNMNYYNIHNTHSYYYARLLLKHYYTEQIIILLLIQCKILIMLFRTHYNNGSWLIK